MTVCLVLAGFDPSGGAGVLVDARALEAAGSRAVAVITANTAQNTCRMTRMEATSPELFREQLLLLSADFRMDAVKIGLVPTKKLLQVIKGFLQEMDPKVPVVYDPVLRATAGFQLYGGMVQDLRELVSLCTVVTPNVPELAAMTSRPVETGEQRRVAASLLLQWGAGAVLVKAGHLSGAEATDELFFSEVPDAEPQVIRFPMPRLDIPSTRGTGCFSSSLICGFLASGLCLEEAVRRARTLLQEKLQSTWIPNGDIALF